MGFIVAIFVVSFLGLLYGARFSLKSLISLGKLLQQRDYIVALFFLGIGTSLPELFVGISSALAGNSAISFANIVGANIINITLLIGVTIIIAGRVVVKNQVFTSEAVYAIVAACLPLLFVLADGTVTRADGAVLLILYGLYYWWLFLKHRDDRNMAKPPAESVQHHRSSLLATGGSFVIGLAVLYLASGLLINSGAEIMRFLQIPVYLLGLFIITFGTTTPELVVDVTSALKKRPGFALGNLYGTLIGNSCFVVGVTALISPIQLFNTNFVALTTLYFVLAVALFFFFARTRNVYTRGEGFVLVLVYILFLISAVYTGVSSGMAQ